MKYLNFQRNAIITRMKYIIFEKFFHINIIQPKKIIMHAYDIKALNKIN